MLYFTHSSVSPSFWWTIGKCQHFTACKAHLHTFNPPNICVRCYSLLLSLIMNVGEVEWFLHTLPAGNTGNKEESKVVLLLSPVCLPYRPSTTMDHSNSDFITAWMFVIGEHSLSLLKSNKNCGFTSQERLQIGPEGADAKIPWLISTCVRHNSKKSHCPFSHKSKSSSILALWYKTTCGKRNTVLEEPHIYLDLEIKDGVSQMRSTKDIPSQRNLPGGTGGCLKSCGKTLRVGYWNQAHP